MRVRNATFPIITNLISNVNVFLDVKINERPPQYTVRDAIVLRKINSPQY